VLRCGGDSRLTYFGPGVRASSIRRICCGICPLPRHRFFYSHRAPPQLHHESRGPPPRIKSRCPLPCAQCRHWGQAVHGLGPAGTGNGRR
jgi:hypothetical protein